MISARARERIWFWGACRRNTASKQDLIEPIQVDEESLDRENIKYNFSSMMKNLDIPKDEVHEMTLEGEPEDSNWY